MSADFLCELRVPDQLATAATSYTFLEAVTPLCSWRNTLDAKSDVTNPFTTYITGYRFVQPISQPISFTTWMWQVPIEQSGGLTSRPSLTCCGMLGVIEMPAEPGDALRTSCEALPRPLRRFRLGRFVLHSSFCILLFFIW